MATGRARHPWIHAAIVALVAALSVASCAAATPSIAPSAAPTAAPTPTAKPTLSPSPTPIDVTAAFLKAISAKDFSASTTAQGTLKVGPTTATLTGTGTIAGRNDTQSLTIKAGSATQVTMSKSIGATSWSKVDSGPWLEDPAPATPKKGLDDYLNGLTAVVDLGVETIDGRQLHHIQAKAGSAIPAEYADFASGDNAKDGSFTIDFYATANGTPAVIVLAGTWTAVIGDTEAAASLTYNLTLNNVGTPYTITPPQDVWVRYTSKELGYTMAHPPDWTVKSEKDGENFLLDGQPYVYVALTTYKGTTSQFAADLKTTYLKPFKGNPASETKKTLGGQAAVRLVYQYANANGVKVTIADDVTTRAGKGWEVFLATNGGAQDILLFNTFVSTFKFTK